MTCLTVKQPWATLLVRGATQYVISSWRTFHRGRLAVHASAKFPRSHIELCCEDDMRRFLQRHGYDYAFELPTQALLGTVTVTDCLPVTEANRDFFDPEDPAVVFGLVQPDRWVWVCTRPESFPQPIPLPGRPALFKVPDALVRDARRNE